MKAVVLLSGGLDSTVLLAHLLNGGATCLPLAVAYGQRHARELDSARRVADYYGLPLNVADANALRPLFGRDNSQTGRLAVPKGRWDDPAMQATVVPNRNMVLLALARAYAIGQGAGAVAYACHAGDHAVYPDCRPEFVQAMGQALALCHDPALYICTPFLHWSKADIVRHGRLLGAPLPLTWSCYRGEAKPCGRCGACVERDEAFHLAGAGA